MSSDEREMADTRLIISGGPTDGNFASEFVKERKYPYVWSLWTRVSPSARTWGSCRTLRWGDFDTFGLERMEELRKKEGWATDVHKPEKGRN